MVRRRCGLSGLWMGVEQGLWRGGAYGCVAPFGADAAPPEKLCARCADAFGVTECKIFAGESLGQHHYRLSPHRIARLYILCRTRFVPAICCAVNHILPAFLQINGLDVNSNCGLIAGASTVQRERAMGVIERIKPATKLRVRRAAQPCR